jgi:hypothetical protein
MLTYAADEHIAKPPELLEQDRIIWNDLPPEKLGPIAVSDEVLVSAAFSY